MPDLGPLSWAHFQTCLAGCYMLVPRNEADDEIPRRDTHTTEHAETDRPL
jgi:hypothetical protein